MNRKIAAVILVAAVVIGLLIGLGLGALVSH